VESLLILFKSCLLLLDGTEAAIKNKYRDSTDTGLIPVSHAHTNNTNLYQTKKSYQLYALI